MEEQIKSLESLVKRLESAIAKIEGGNITSGTATVSVANPAPPMGTLPPLPPPPPPAQLLGLARVFENKILVQLSALEQAAKNTELAQIIQITSEMFWAFMWQFSIFEVSDACRRPSSIEELSSLSLPLLAQTATRIKKYGYNNPKFSVHAGMVNTALEIFGWAFQPAPLEFLKEMVPNLDFNMNKIFRQKQEKLTAWARLIKALFLSFLEFVTDNCRIGLTWKGIEGIGIPEKWGKVKDRTYTAWRGGEKEEPKTGAQGMFAEINALGEDIKKGLKHVEKEDKKAQIAIPEGLPAPPAHIPSKPKETKLGKTKEPNIVTRGKMIYYENFINDISLKEEDVDKKLGYYFVNCNKIKIEIAGKARTIMLQNCNNVKLYPNEIISAIEVINCKKINILVKTKIPSITVEEATEIDMYMQDEGKNTVISTCRSTVVVCHIFDQEANDWFEHLIPQKMTSNYVDGKLKTEFVIENE